MSSVASAASTNPGLTNLLQSLTQIGSPLASSPQVLAALQKAPPADIAELSAEAIQLAGGRRSFWEPRFQLELILLYHRSQ